MKERVPVRNEWVIGYILVGHQRHPTISCILSFFRKLSDIFKKYTFSTISLRSPVITARNSSCGEVMFSQACVKNSLHRGSMHGMHVPRHACPQAYPPGTHTRPLPAQACTPPGMHAPSHTPPRHAHPLDIHAPWHAHPSHTPPPPHTPADTTRCGQWGGGTHPTGMHSCLMLILPLLQTEDIIF